MSQPRPRISKSPFLFFFLVLSLYMPSLSNGQTESPPKTSTPVALINATVPPIEPMEVNVIPELVGELSAYRKVSLGFRINGRLASVSLFAGELASEGAIIAQLEPQDFDLAVKQAEANLDAQKARLRMQQAGARPEERKQANENVSQTKANMENAKADYERTAQLLSTGAVSQQAQDSASARKDVTLAQYQTALQAKALVDQGPRAEEKEVTRAQVRQLESALAAARLQRSYTELKPPFPALVASRLLDEGSYVTPSTAVYTLVQADPIFVTADCPEAYVPLLKPGMTARILVDALPKETFTGTLLRIPSTLDPKTRSAKIEIIVPNPLLHLKPGMFARVSLTPPPERQ